MEVRKEYCLAITFIRWDGCSVLIPQSVEAPSPKYWIKSSLWQCSWVSFNWRVCSRASKDNLLSLFSRCPQSPLTTKESKQATSSEISALFKVGKATSCCKILLLLKISTWVCLMVFPFALFIPFAPLPALLSGATSLNLYDSSFLAGNSYFLKASSCFLSNGLAAKYVCIRD